MANLLQPQMTGTGHRYGHLLPPVSGGVIKGAKLSYAGGVCVCVSIDPLINFMKHSNIDHKIGVPIQRGRCDWNGCVCVLLDADKKNWYAMK